MTWYPKIKKKSKKTKDLKTCYSCKYDNKGCKNPHLHRLHGICDEFKWSSTMKCI